MIDSFCAFKPPHIGTWSGPFLLSRTEAEIFSVQCRSDYPEDVTEMSGPRIAAAYRTDVNMSIYKIMTGKQKVPPPDN